VGGFGNLAWRLVCFLVGGFPAGANTAARHDLLGIAKPLDLGGDYVKKLSVFQNGRIRAQFLNVTPPVNALIKNKVFELRPTVSSGVITSWTCFTKPGNPDWVDQEYISSCD
jgi:hypothetical protein